MNREEQETMALRQALALTLLRLREQKAVAQETLALESGVARSHLSSLERAIGNPTLRTIDRLLRHLGANFAEFGRELDRHLHRKSS